MNSRKVIPILTCLGLVIWSGIVFFYSLNGDFLWKQVVSGIGFVLSSGLLVLGLKGVRKSAKPR